MTKEATPKSDVFISLCGYGYSQKPSAVTLTCADGGMYLDNVTYESWNSDGALGYGDFVRNNCDPDCASGKDISIPVTVNIRGITVDSNERTIYKTLTISARQELFNGNYKYSFDIATPPEN